MVVHLRKVDFCKACVGMLAEIYVQDMETMVLLK